MVIHRPLRRRWDGNMKNKYTVHVNIPDHKNYSFTTDTAEQAAYDLEDIASVRGLTGSEIKFFTAVYEGGRRMEMKAKYIPENEMLDITLT